MGRVCGSVLRASRSKTLPQLSSGMAILNGSYSFGRDTPGEQVECCTTAPRELPGYILGRERVTMSKVDVTLERLPDRTRFQENYWPTASNQACLAAFKASVLAGK